MSCSYPGGSPEEEEDPAKNSDHQDYQYQDDITCDRRASFTSRGGRIQPLT